MPIKSNLQIDIEETKRLKELEEEDIFQYPNSFKKHVVIQSQRNFDDYNDIPFDNEDYKDGRFDEEEEEPKEIVCISLSTNRVFIIKTSNKEVLIKGKCKINLSLDNA